MKILMHLLVIFILCTTSIQSQLLLKEAFPNLEFKNLIDLQNAADGTDRLFAVSQNGTIEVFPNSPEILSSDIFLDISNIVAYGGERGLLGLAFHPKFNSNGYFYVYYSSNKANESIISRFSVSSQNSNQAISNSEQIVLTVFQPYSNHNGGQIAFGPDGYLYIALGDGGSGGDPLNHGQNLETLLGSILRIDIDNKTDNQNYDIPEDNPFKDNQSGYREEIYAYGLRNPWRFCFDPNNGKLITGDVGQNLWEEINIIENGKNYGWRLMEGSHCYNPGENCDDGTITYPIWEYAHNQSGGWSITGGHVYRVNSESNLYGKYIYADYVSGNIWALNYDAPTIRNELLFKSSLNISSFGKDIYGNIYICDLRGKIYQLENPIVSVNVYENTMNYQNYITVEQNYPNPFNPITKIRFSSSIGQKIKIKIFDVLGNYISTIFNDFAIPDIINEIEFNANQFDSMVSGIYYYKVESENFAKTGKMILLK